MPTSWLEGLWRSLLLAKGSTTVTGAYLGMFQCHYSLKALSKNISVLSITTQNILQNAPFVRTIPDLLYFL